ncbi:RNA-binding protein [Archaeoglobales archaeon]|nr:MAG: RNA-binding protein [Archaeoglobales archaeon]
MNIYVGNLPYNVKEDELRKIFESYGKVSSVNLIKDRFSGRSKGFAFIEMYNDEEVKAAIEAIDGTHINGREIKVNVAKPRNDKRR